MNFIKNKYLYYIIQNILIGSIIPITDCTVNLTLTPDQIVELLQQGIYHYNINPEFTQVLFQFQNMYPTIFSYTYEHNLNYIDYFRCLNSKLIFLNEIHLSEISNLSYVTSNFIPEQPLYDFFISDPSFKNFHNYQLKNKLTISSFKIHDINFLLNKYNISYQNQNYLVFDISTLNINSQNKLEFFVKNEFSSLFNHKKIIIHKSNLLNTSVLNTIEHSKNIFKIKF